ncbi:MAG: peptidoglycan DD-metalloendopeptidase family protein [Oscillospiraceae bacterium]
MHYNKVLRMVLSAVLVTLMAVLPIATTMSASAKSVSELNDAIKDLNNEKAEIQGNINKLKANKADQEKIRDALQKQVQNTQSQIDVYTSKIATYNAEISKINREIDEKNIELEKNKQLFKQRLRAIYMSGSDVNSLSILLSSDDFSDLLAKAQLTKSVSEYDKALTDQILKDISEINTKKETVSVKQKELIAMKQDLAIKQKELNSQLGEVNGTIATISGQKNDLDKQLAAAKKAYDNAEAELNKALNPPSGGGGSNVKYEGGEFNWPVKGFYHISSPYGWRPNPFNPSRPEFHKGIDISSSGIAGKPVTAAKSGQIIIAGFNNGGYGNYVVIDHGVSGGGQRYTTHYAHMRSIAVSVGQTVSKGQVVGYVGTTGSSTGNHLHFEVRVNNATTNPMSYFN